MIDVSCCPLVPSAALAVEGDRGYPLEPFLMTPFDEPATEGERQYNTSHSSTREVMEQTLQTMKSRFRRIHQSSGALQYEPIKCAKIAAACMWLHNRCVQRRIPLPEDVEGDTAVEEDVDDNEVENEDDAPGYETRRDIVEECFP
ncbi:putative nuclease HARBI1 [Chionoecetes opilio]|uniref:Putative nuclease HARBI1 n=1 Tax=Chionoecetes opilio TaxID=41210 RepID=A0A8J4Y7Y1_CHIOP|nr:putative nuclease HARBI1 [Chionoecetes opilio]